MKYVTEPIEDVMRPHVYDGIQEYDKRLPNWWLWTLYGTIAFSFLYWAYYHTYDVGLSPIEHIETELAENRKSAERRSGVINDEHLWALSQNPAAIAAGNATFEATCASCHKPDMTGLIGPNLLDHEWIHGGTPMDALKVISEGVLTKGMPAWSSVLGQQKIAEVTAFIFSKHKPGEPVVAVPGWTMPGIPAPPPAPSP